MTLDSVDRQILQIMQESAQLSAETIANTVNLSPSAVTRRLTRLKQERVIEKITAVVNPLKVGLALTVLTRVKFESNRPNLQEAFRRWAKKEGTVQGCWHIAGDFDYFLIFVVRDLDTYNTISQQMMSAGLGLHRVESIVSFQTIKRGLEVDIFDPSQTE
jgi:DNA-binding Lrp family transcriptional regulator